MENNSAAGRLSPLAYELLTYLAEHPEAQDTLVGVMHWWLLKQQTQYSQPQVQAALEQLLIQDLLVVRQAHDKQIRYAVNQQRFADIQALVTANSTDAAGLGKHEI